MAANPVTSLLAQVLSRTPVMTPALLRATYTAATRAGDGPLVARIIGREDAPADLVTQFADSSDPDVRYAYAYRTHRATPTGDRKRERRAAVLATGLSAPYPHRTVVEDALDAFTAKPTRTLLHALRDKDASWFTPDQAYAVLLEWDTEDLHHPQSGPFTPPIALVARLGPERATTLLSVARSPWLVALLASHDVPVAPVITALRRVFAMATPRLKQGAANECGSTIRTALTYRGDAERAQIRDDLVAYCDREQSSTLTYKVIAAAAGLPPRRMPPVWDLTVAVLPPEVVTASNACRGQLVALSASDDPAVLSELVARLENEPEISIVARAAATLLCNPDLPVADRHRLTTCLLGLAYGPRDALEHVDAIALFPDDPFMVNAWLTLHPNQVLARHGWAPFGGRDASAAWLTRWQEATPDSSVIDMEEILASVAMLGVSTTQVRVLSVENVELLCATPDASGAAGVAAVAALLTEHLGDNLGCWATFEALTANFTGTFGELLDTCHTVSA